MYIKKKQTSSSTVCKALLLPLMPGVRLIPSLCLYMIVGHCKSQNREKRFPCNYKVLIFI